jgi:conjugal transfer ATP-binding protein TraC
MRTPKNKIVNLMSNDKFSELLPVVEYWDEEKIFILDGPAIGAMFVCSPTAGCNDEIRNALNNLYKSDFPKNTTIQASLVSMPDIENNLYGYNVVRGNRMMNKDEEQCDTMADSIHDFYRKGAKESINESGFRFRNFEFWFTVKFDIKKTVPSSKEIAKFNESMRTVHSMLTSFSPVRANEFDYKRRMNVLMNMYGESSWENKAHHQDKAFVNKPLREMVLDVGKCVEVKHNGLSVKDVHGDEAQFIKSMSITDMPEQMMYGQMLNLVGDWELGHTGLFEHFMLTFNVVYPDQVKAKREVLGRKSFITNQARGPIIQYLDKLRFQKKDYDAINREIDQESSKIIKYSLQVLTFNRNEAEAEAFAEKIKGTYSRKNVKIVQDNYFTLPFVLGGLPFGMDNNYVKLSSRFNDATSKVGAFFTPHMASWKGNSAYPTFMMASRLGQVVNLDFFESETNYNIYCAATSGAGKSFFTGYLTNAMLGSGIKKVDVADREKVKPNDGSQVFIIDVGRSYEGLASQYEESQFLVFGRDFKYSLNPFPSIDDFYGKEGQANMLRTLIKTMASPSGGISDLQNAEILAVLSALWDANGKKSTITQFSQLCLDHSIIEMQNIGRQLRPFCEGGIYGDFFSDKYPPVDFNGRLVVCELEELKSDIHLQVTVLMSLVMGIQHAMYLSGTDRRKMFILDEGWQYLKEDGSGVSMMDFFAEFLETGWRRFRKYNAAGALVTQSVMDAYSSSAGRAIIANSAWLLLMKQNQEAVSQLEDEKAYSGDKGDFSLLRSLRTVKPQPGVSNEAFSEVFVRYEGQKQVCRLYTDRRLQLILTTNPIEKAARQEFINQGMSLSQAIDALLEKERLVTG